MKKICLFVLMTLLLSSCAEQITRVAQYPKMYEEQPLTIAVMPPINRTNFVEAKDYFYTTLYAPLCEKGYYVYSPMMTMEMFQAESAYDAEMFLEADLGQFRNVLGADAAMFTIIKSWSRDKIGGTLKAGVEYVLRSTKTGQTLYQREGLITLDTSVKSNNNNSLFGALVEIAATAVNTAATDKVVAGRQCTLHVLSDMPEGKYGPMYGKDQDQPAGERFVRATLNY